MMCIINYISAAMRLKEAQKTVIMLREDKYSDRGVPEMVLAQRDMIKRERDYFLEECIMFGFKVIIFICVVVVVAGIWHLHELQQAHLGN